MEAPEVCPSCLGKFRDIRGLVYTAGVSVGIQCRDRWHNRPVTISGEFTWTPEDLALLRMSRIKAD